MSRSRSAFQRGALPMMTASITRNSSNANWSWCRTPNFFGRVTEPFGASSSPVRIFIKVDLPAPLGPVMAYRRPARNVQVTSSNSILAPKRMEMLLRESKGSFYDTRLAGFGFGRRLREEIVEFRGKIDDFRVFDFGIIVESKRVIGFRCISCPPHVLPTVFVGGGAGRIGA